MKTNKLQGSLHQDWVGHPAAMNFTRTLPGAFSFGKEPDAWEATLV